MNELHKAFKGPLAAFGSYHPLGLPETSSASDARMPGSCSWRGHRLRKGRGTGRRGGFLRSCHDLAGGGCCTCLLGTWGRLWGLLCSTLLRSGSSGLCLGGSSGLCRGGSSGLRRGGSSGSGRGRKRSCWLRRFRLRRFALCSSSPDLCRLFYCYWWGWGRFFLFLLWLLLLVLFIILACLIIVLSLFVFTLLLVITLFLLFLLWNSSQLLVLRLSLESRMPEITKAVRTNVIVRRSTQLCSTCNQIKHNQIRTQLPQLAFSSVTEADLSAPGSKLHPNQERSLYIYIYMDTSTPAPTLIFSSNSSSFIVSCFARTTAVDPSCSSEQLNCRTAGVFWPWGNLYKETSATKSPAEKVPAQVLAGIMVHIQADARACSSAQILNLVGLVPKSYLLR